MSALVREAVRRGVRVPTATTLRRYGLTADDWLALLASQGWKCPVCLKTTSRFVTDHEHVPLWKHKPPAERRRFVRGIPCLRCNHRLIDSRIDAETSQRITNYLRAYEARRDA